MKNYPPTVFSDEIWKEFEFLFWRETVPCFSEYDSGDGIVPEEIHTTKRGIEIFGRIWFLKGSRENPAYRLHLCLEKTSFPMIDSVSVPSVSFARIFEASLNSGDLHVVVGIPK